MQLQDAQHEHRPNLNEPQSLDSQMEKSSSLCGGTVAESGSGLASGGVMRGSPGLVPSTGKVWGLFDGPICRAWHLLL